MKRKLITSLFPVVLGGFIYVIYRPDHLLMFKWFNKIGILPHIEFLRSSKLLYLLVIPNWVKYSLPDALWLFSLNQIILTLWNFKINRQSVFWFFLSSSIGISSEIGQLVKVIPGTFDLTDLLLLLTATIMPFFLNKFNKN
jgi:hypothetical protein